MSWEHDLVARNGGTLLTPFLHSFDCLGRHWRVAAWTLETDDPHDEDELLHLLAVGVLTRTESGKREDLQTLALASLPRPEGDSGDAPDANGLELHPLEGPPIRLNGAHEITPLHQDRHLILRARGQELGRCEAPPDACKKILQTHNRILDALRRGTTGGPVARAPPRQRDRPMERATAVVDASNVARWGEGGHGDLTRLRTLVTALRQKGYRVIVVSDRSLENHLRETERNEYKRHFTRPPHHVAPEADSVIRRIALQEQQRGRTVTIVANDTYHDAPTAELHHIHTTGIRRLRFTFDGPKVTFEGMT